MKDYKRILEGVVNIINTTEKSDIGFTNICSYIGENCPELKESEDEKAVKNIIESLNTLISRIEDDAAAPNAKAFLIEEIEKQIAWLERQDEHKKFLDSIQVGDKVTRNEDGVLVNLSQLNRVAKKDEKQGEQKPWSEKDEKYFNAIISIIKKNQSLIRLEDWDINWLESIKDRVQTQPQQEWSEEDIVAIDSAVDALSKDLPSLAASLRRIKSLMPQNRWKPSDEQMDALLYIFRHYKTPAATDKFALEALQTLGLMLEQLKKLRGPKPTRV